MNENKGENRIDLLNGGIARGLLWLALPIMGSQFVHMAYNMFDTMWVGQIGNQAVTAVGTAGSFMWIGQGIAMIPQLGGQIMAGQSIGEGDMPKARRFARESIQVMLIVMLLYSAISIIFRHQLIGVFNLHDSATIASAEFYLLIVSAGHALMGFNFVMQGLLTATGDSKTSFKYNAIGMLLNILLDPLLIFGVGFFPELGVNGAAIATVFSECIVAGLFARFVIRDDYLFEDFHLFDKLDRHEVAHIAKLGAPPSIFTIGFACISIAISRIIVSYGDAAIAIQKIGGQIESVSWMSSDGFAYAMNSFTAQNFGAGKYDRVKKGFDRGMQIMTIYGLFTTALLILAAAPIFDIFINEPDVIAGGATYLRIAGISQLFICYEIVTTGAFNGLGKTRLPAIVSLALTVSRIPLCYILAPVFGGINGVWWAISITSILKGVILMVVYMHELKKLQAPERPAA